MSRLDKQEEEIGHLQFLAEAAGETLEVPKFYKVWKVLSAVEKFPNYENTTTTSTRVDKINHRRNKTRITQDTRK